MLQIEQANTGRQIDEAQALHLQLTKIDIHKSSDKVILGSLVKTNNGSFFISVALGKIEVDGQTFFALSRNAPLGQRLFGLQVNNEVEVNGKKYIILDIM